MCTRPFPSVERGGGGWSGYEPTPIPGKYPNLLGIAQYIISTLMSAKPLASPVCLAGFHRGGGGGGRGGNRESFPS